MFPYSTLLTGIISVIVGFYFNVFKNEHFITSLAFVSISFILGMQIDCYYKFYLGWKNFVPCKKAQNYVAIDDAIQQYVHMADVKRRKEELITEFTQLGKGVVTLLSRDQVYQYDSLIIKQMKRGETLCATVPTIGGKPKNQFESTEFLNYIDAQIEACKRGVDINRLYLLEDETELTNTVMKRHLTKLTNGGVVVKYILGTSIMDAEQRRQWISIDMNLFDKLRVSQGHPGNLLDLMSTEYMSDDVRINQLWSRWDSLWNDEHAKQFPIPT